MRNPSTRHEELGGLSVCLGCALAEKWTKVGGGRRTGGEQIEEQGYGEAWTFIVKGNKTDGGPIAGCREAALQVRITRLAAELYISTEERNMLEAGEVILFFRMIVHAPPPLGYGRGSCCGRLPKRPVFVCIFFTLCTCNLMHRHPQSSGGNMQTHVLTHTRMQSLSHNLPPPPPNYVCPQVLFPPSSLLTLPCVPIVLIPSQAGRP